MSKIMGNMSPEQVGDALVQLAEQHLREIRAKNPNTAKPTTTAVLDFLENAGYMPAREFSSFHRAAIAHRIGALLERWT